MTICEYKDCKKQPTFGKKGKKHNFVKNINLLIMLM